MVLISIINNAVKSNIIKNYLKILRIGNETQNDMIIL